MWWSTLRAGVAVMVVTVAWGVGGLAPAADDDGFTPLFNGKDLTGFKTILKGDGDPAKTWTVRDGVIICSGSPAGYFYTDKSYKNYVLRFDWRYARPANLADDKAFKGNSGLLVHIQGEHKVWPRCVEVQGMNADHGRIFAIGGAKGQYTVNKEAQAKAIKPVGEWNTTEVICKDGEITSKVNGIEVSTGKGELTEGPIGWQSEGAEIHFRNIRIKELK
ncbi:MAG: DUF1080 domain-containing protein [Gemmataceae bacterium]|nr:DUF1080 domain-containing protein [Gemmataceae bacterium]MDW8265210.1 DUF1080 domain-containing protein [Gemmataceae bacterium]